MEGTPKPVYSEKTHWRTHHASLHAPISQRLAQAGYIRLQEGKPVWDTHCTYCTACICGCPSEAVEYGRRSRGKRHYRCPEDVDLF